MKYIKYLILLICLSTPVTNYACWDDDYDDYDWYDDDYDDDDWWDDDDDDEDDNDDEDSGWNENDDWWYDDDDDNKDDNSSNNDVIWLDEVVCVAPDLSNNNDDNNNDWYDDDNYDYGDNDEEDDTSVGSSYHPDNNATENTNLPPLLPNEVHKPVEGEKLFKENLPAQTLKQSTNMDCVSTSLGIVYSLTGSEQTAAEIRHEVEQIYQDKTGNIINIDGVNSNENLDVLFTDCGLFWERISTSDIVSVLNEGDPAVAVIEGTDGIYEHMVVIVGYYDDGIEKDAFQCINPGTGKYETHYSSEFTVRDLNNTSNTNTYIYRKN